MSEPTFVRFWGTRGSIPTPGYKTRRFGGNTSCVEIRSGETELVCDGGTGLRELGLELMQRGRPKVEAHFFFSHMHWDHIQGFPFFVPAYGADSELTVYEVSAGDDRVQKLLHGQMRSEYFPVEFGDLGARIAARHFEAGTTTVGSIRVQAYEQRHPGRSYAYSFELGGKKIVYATDSELDLLLENRDESLSDLDALRRLPASLLAFVDGADLLIADGQYTDAEYPKKVGWGHARANTVADLAHQAGIKQCAVFHHDPMHSDDIVDQKIQDACERLERFGAKTQLFGAREGLELKF
ncbi:MAG TPA: MBL fold metallo-hydrolase [Polyangiaceae bacterium]|nr:MBL fold metallo-hydrolase [Polyangiaceae bacterium]